MDDFFEVRENSTTERGFVKTIRLNSAHAIYGAHFPGYPVTPGVIQLQIVHELIEKHLGRKLNLVAMPSCKFTKLLNPNETELIDVNVEFNQTEELVHIKAWGENGADIFFKLNSTYRFRR